MKTLNVNHRRTLAALTAALVTVFGAVSQSTAANIECQPNVRVTNDKGASIKVLRMEYTVLGKSYKEGLDNKRLAPNETENWPSQKLNHAATGLVVTATRIEYKNDNSGAGDGYGPADWSPWVTHSYTCSNGHNYIHVIG